MSRKIFAAVLVFGGLLASSAQAVDYKIAFQGSGGYSLSGTLSFDDALQGTGLIDETQISDLSIEVFQNGASIGTRSLSIDGLGSTAAAFNVNFDTITGQFLTGGQSFSGAGQNFFSDAGNGCDTVGFSSGGRFQGVCVDGDFLGAVPLSDQTLTATLVTVAPTPGPGTGQTPTPAPAPVPLPATGWLLFAGLGGLVAMRRKRFV